MQIIIDFENIETNDEAAKQYLNEDVVRISDIFKAGVLHGLGLVNKVSENTAEDNNDTATENN